MKKPSGKAGTGGNMPRYASRKPFNNFGIILFLFLLVLLFSLIEPAFLQASNLVNIMRQVATMGICAVGMTMVMLTGGIDLSIGSLMGIINIACAKFIVEQGMHPLAAISACLLIAVLVGAVNAFLVTVIDIPPLITTLGIMTSLRGLAYFFSNGRSIWGFGDGFRSIGREYLGFIPIPVVVMLLIFLLGGVFLNHTRYGRYIYGIGCDENAARLSGINVIKMKFIVYIICSVLTAIAGILLLSRLNTGLPKTGTGLEMEVITAVVLGGVSIHGGKGNFFGVFVGVLIMGVLTNGMMYLNITEYIQLVIRGFVLLFAIGLDNMTKRYKKKNVY